MPGLTETSQWESEIYRIEPNDPVEGGEDGVDNRSAKQLANRTLYLKNTLESLAEQTEDNLETLTELISDEETARGEAVTNETEARADADLLLSIAIAAEITARQNADDAEAAARTNGVGYSIAANGHVKLPAFMGGAIVQWGSGFASDGTTINFPIEFPNACLVVVGCDAGNAPNGFGHTDKSVTGFTLKTDVTDLTYNYITVGY